MIRPGKPESLARLAAFTLIAPAAIPVFCASVLAQETHTVELVGIVFVLSDITINSGDTVHWVWVSGFHNVESGVVTNFAGVHDGRFRSGDPTSDDGTTYDLVFDQAFMDANPVSGNVYPYFCIVHAGVNMVGSVTVLVPDCLSDADCADGNACNGNESCQNGECVSGIALVCDDLSPCTDDSCNSVSGCVNTDNTAGCDDGDSCTAADTCSGGVCVGDEIEGCASCTDDVECADDSPCTDDICVGGKCGHIKHTRTCDDDDPCTDSDFCLNGVCAGTATPGCCADADDCDDSGPCDQKACVDGRCVNEPIENCKPCLDHADCDDSDPCTTDSCESGTCQYESNRSFCDDEDPCTIEDVCSRRVCRGTLSDICCIGDADCRDEDPCTLDTCVAGSCTYESIDGCADETDEGDTSGGVDSEDDPSAPPPTMRIPQLCGAGNLVGAMWIWLLLGAWRWVGWQRPGRTAATFKNRGNESDTSGGW